MNIVNVDFLIIGAGGAGLSAAIKIGEANPSMTIALVSKVYPMRSHTVAAEGGAAAVMEADDSFEKHFEDTVKGGDWLCDQDVVDDFVKTAPVVMRELELYGLPFSRNDDGKIRSRKFGGMSYPRTMHASDKTGFYMLQALFNRSMRVPNVIRYDEYFVIDLVVEDGISIGAIIYSLSEGKFSAIQAKFVILATGGAGQIYRVNTNASTCTGDGLALALRAGYPLRDMEFIQFHPTGLPGSGLLITEGARGEGGYLISKSGRFLEKVAGPIQDEPTPKYMELASRDVISRAIEDEKIAHQTFERQVGDEVYPVVNLRLEHLGKRKILQRLPLIYHMAQTYLGIDVSKEPIPVMPTVHYTMGGIPTDISGCYHDMSVFAIGECASSGLHGANRLGSNSLTELLVMPHLFLERQLPYRKHSGSFSHIVEKMMGKLLKNCDEHGVYSKVPYETRKKLGRLMEENCGIYRNENGLKKCIDEIEILKLNFLKNKFPDPHRPWSINFVDHWETHNLLLVAYSVLHSAYARNESRGAHQRSDYLKRNDEEFLKHTIYHLNENGSHRISYTDVVITTLQPGIRAYGGAGAGK